MTRSAVFQQYPVIRLEAADKYYKISLVWVWSAITEQNWGGGGSVAGPLGWMSFSRWEIETRIGLALAVVHVCCEAETDGHESDAVHFTGQATFLFSTLSVSKTASKKELKM